MYAGFHAERLDALHLFHLGRLPDRLLLDIAQFEELWAVHPQEFHEVIMHGRPVKTPRWQQAYGRDYFYTNRMNRALPILPLMQPFLDWALHTIDDRLNGILMNWYDGTLGHYIGAHRDSTADMVNGSPVVTISLGEERIFRLRPWKARGMREFPATNRTVFIMPWDTDQVWTHEVTRRARDRGRRISITLRAFC